MGVTQRDEHFLSATANSTHPRQHQQKRNPKPTPKPMPPVKAESEPVRVSASTNTTTCECSACTRGVPQQELETMTMTLPPKPSRCSRRFDGKEDEDVCSEHGLVDVQQHPKRLKHLQRHQSFGKAKAKAQQIRARVNFAALDATANSATSDPTATSVVPSRRRHQPTVITTSHDDQNRVSIHAICENGNSSVLKHLLGYFVGHDTTRIVNTVCSCGMTPLQISCRANNFEIVKLLLKHRADPMRSKRKRTSCLAFACLNQNLKLVKLLLQYGTSVDEEALVAASRCGHHDILRCLVVPPKPLRFSPLDKALSYFFVNYQPHQHRDSLTHRHPVDPSIQKQKGFTDAKTELDAAAFSKAAAAAASSSQDHTVFKLLLGSGTTPPSRERIADALLYGCSQSNLELVQCLVEYYDLKSLSTTQNPSLGHQDTPLHIAVSRCNHELVELLLNKAQLDVNIRDRRGITPLYIACARGFAEIAAILLDAGAKAFAMGPGHETPLHIAAQENHLECVELLLDQQVLDIECVTQDHCTPLHLASQCGNTQIVQCLLRRGANIHAMTACQETPMIKASRMSHFDTVRALVAHEHDSGNGQVENLDDVLFVAQSHRHTTLRSLIGKCAR